MGSKVLNNIWNIYFAKDYVTLARSDKSRYKNVEEKGSRKGGLGRMKNLSKEWKTHNHRVARNLLFLMLDCSRR